MIDKYPKGYLKTISLLFREVGWEQSLENIRDNEVGDIRIAAHYL